jgi:hypothetical protein
MATLRFIQLSLLMVQVVLSILKPAGSEGATVQLVIVPPELLKVMNEITLSWAGVTDATTYRVYQTTDTTFAQAGNSDPSQFSTYSPAATSMWW